MSALVLLLVVRPKLGQWRAVGPYGLELGLINHLFYCALAGAGIDLIAPWHGQGINFLGLAFALAADGYWANDYFTASGWPWASLWWPAWELHSRLVEAHRPSWANHFVPVVE